MCIEIVLCFLSAQFLGQQTGPYKVPKGIAFVVEVLVREIAGRSIFGATLQLVNGEACLGFLTPASNAAPS